MLVAMSRHGARSSRALVLLAALGAISAASANLIEDGLGVDAAGTAYFLSILLTMLSMLALAATLVARRPRWPGAVVFSTVIGLITLQSGGGILILLAWGFQRSPCARRGSCNARSSGSPSRGCRSGSVYAATR